MYDAFLVRGFERIGDLFGKPDRLLLRNRAFLDPRGQRLPLDQFGPTSCSVQMFGWFSELMTRASRSNRSPNF